MNENDDKAPAVLGQAGRAALGSFLGAVVEWYDFLLYGIVAALVFQKVFFPDVGPVVGTLAAFATFGVGFLFRPLGGIIFGHFGDKLGRKRMLLWTMSLMGAATFMIGVIPSYGTIGWAAPVLLVLLRIIQGFAVGGEWGGAALMAVESAPSNRKTLFSSGVQVGYSTGLLLATAAVTVMSHFVGDAEFTAWGWRIPFLLSAVLVMVGLWVRKDVEESPTFLAAAEHRNESVEVTRRQRLPIVAAVRSNPGAFFRIIGLRLAELLTTYVVTTFALNYSTTHLHYNRDFMLGIGILVGTLGIITVPCYAWLADRYGLRRIYLLGATLGVLFTIPFWIALEQQQRFLVVICAFVLVNGCNGMVVSVQQPLFVEMFGAQFRYSGAGVGYQIASTIGGGFTPFIAAGLTAAAGGAWYPTAVYVTAGCLISFLLMATMKSRSPIEESGTLPRKTPKALRPLSVEPMPTSDSVIRPTGSQ